MKKTAILLYDSFCNFEISVALEILALAEKPITVFGITKQAIRSEDGLSIFPDDTIDNLDLDAYDSLILPGAMDIRETIENERIVTTETRAKEVRKTFDKMVTYGKKGTLVSRRLALAFLHNDSKAVDKVFNELAPRYKDRNGGYTRIIKKSERKGDSALEVILELV